MGNESENTMKNDNSLGWVIAYIAVFGLIAFWSGYANAGEGVPCERSARKAEVMRSEYAGVLYDTWRRAGRREPTTQLQDEAYWRAYYILRDNNMICVPRKARMK